MTATTPGRHRDHGPFRDRDGEIAELHARVAERVQTFAPDWVAWMGVMRRLPSYSLRNQILIDDQLPGATRVASANTWKLAFDRTVKPGEVGLKIMRPVIDRRANPSRPAAFTVARVYDVSQTTGRPLPLPPDGLDLVVPGMAPPGLQRGLIAAADAVGFAVEFDADPRAAPGSTMMWGGQVITIGTATTDAQATAVLAHEVGHAYLHPLGSRIDRGLKEVEAESVAHVLAGLYGMDIELESADYMVGWAAQSYPSNPVEAMAATYDRVCDAVRRISAYTDPAVHAAVRALQDDPAPQTPMPAAHPLHAPLAAAPAAPVRSPAGIDAPVQPAVPELGGP